MNVKEGKINISLIKDKVSRPYFPEREKIALDLGLNELFACNDGNLFGRNFKRKLLRYDLILTKLMKNLQKQGIKPSKNKRYKNLTNDVREYLKNEINRILNRIIDLYKPREIVLEKLNFQNSNLSRKMNRVLNNFGKGIITKKLESIEEEFGIVITYINPAYTSQECSKCGYVDKNNRKSQKEFECKCCGNKKNADVNGSRAVFKRSSFKELNVYRSKRYILNFLLREFVARVKRERCLYSRARFLVRWNDYFNEMKGFL